MRRLLTLSLFMLFFASRPAAADTLVFTNGDRLTGTLVAMDTQWVQFESTLVGRVEVPRSAIELVRREEIPTEAARAAAGALLVRAQDNPGLTDLWVADFDAAFSLTSGNADTRSVNVQTRAARDTDRDRTSLYLTSVFASNSTSGEPITTANAIRGGGRYEVDVSDRLFTFGFSDLEFDRFQGLDLRWVLGGGLGLYLIDRPGHDLQIFAGGSSNFEYFELGDRRKSAEAVIGEEWIYNLTDNTTIEERLAIFPNLSDVGEYRVNFDSAIVTRLNNWLSWQLSLSDRYLSNPRAGKKGNDLLFTTGIRITLGEGDLQSVGPSTIEIQ